MAVTQNLGWSLQVRYEVGSVLQILCQSFNPLA